MNGEYKLIKFELNRAGVAELMKSPAIQDCLTDKANQLRNVCGSGYEQDLHVGVNRANAMVWPKSIKAKRSNSKNNTLLLGVNAIHD